MLDSLVYALPGPYTGYVKYDKRHSAYIARIVSHDTGAAVVAMNHATPEDAKRWLETLAAQKHRERQEAGT